MFGGEPAPFLCGHLVVFKNKHADFFFFFLSNFIYVCIFGRAGSQNTVPAWEDLGQALLPSRGG